MTMHRDTFSHTNHLLDPLPDDFDLSLRAMDQRLAQDARRMVVPRGLANRVVEASLASKSAVVAAGPSRPRLRLVNGTTAPMARPLHRQVWARLAMAASFGIACALAIGLLHTPTPRDAGRLAMNDHEIRTEVLASALNPAHIDSSVQYEEALGHYSETVYLTSDDFVHDLEMLVSRF